MNNYLLESMYCSICYLYNMCDMDKKYSCINFVTDVNISRHKK